MPMPGFDKDFRWDVTPEKVDAVVRRTIEVARPKQVYLFGSCAHPKSDGSRPNDLDMLVVVDDSVEKDYLESGRIRQAMDGIQMPIDILVARKSTMERYRAVEGYIYKEALDNGRLVYDAG
jgi:predicted nucleotidyltransferase